jgi:hypothetical protein
MTASGRYPRLLVAPFTHLKQAPQSHPERTNRAYIYFIAKVNPFGSGV